MRALRILLPLVVLIGTAGGPAVAGTTRAAGACDQDVIVSVDNLSVVVTPVPDVVHAGQRARFEVTVGRPGRSNPTGLGPGLDLPAYIPAAGVRAAVWIPLEPNPLAALGETDEQGTAIVEIPIPATTRGGTVDLRGFAWNTIVNGCLTLEEVGQVDVTGALTIKARKR